MLLTLKVTLVKNDKTGQEFDDMSQNQGSSRYTMMKEGLGKEDEHGYAHSSVNSITLSLQRKERVKLYPKPSKRAAKVGSKGNLAVLRS